MLVILKHEKPIKDLPDLVADRLSKMEGVDGSGVAVSMFDAVAGKDFIVRAEALEDARYRGDAVEPLHTGGYVMQSNGTGQPIRARSDSHPYYEKHYDEIVEEFPDLRQLGAKSLLSVAHPTTEERAALSAAIKQTVVVNRAVDTMSPEQLDKYARMRSKGIGENLI